MSNLTSVVSELEQERTHLTSQLAALGNTLAALKRSSSDGTARQRTMSAAGRARIAAAKRAR
jgi:hypothetical protein